MISFVPEDLFPLHLISDLAGWLIDDKWIKGADSGSAGSESRTLISAGSRSQVFRGTALHLCRLLAHLLLTLASHSEVVFGPSLALCEKKEEKKKAAFVSMRPLC